MRLPLFIGLSLLLHLTLGLLGLDLSPQFETPLAGGGEVSVTLAPLISPGTGDSFSKPIHSALPKGDLGEKGTGEKGRGIGSGPQGDNKRLAEILSRIEQKKMYPLLANRMGITGRVLVHFRIDPQGKATSVQLAQSSGSALLDNSALSTIEGAAPYPPYTEPLSVWIGYKEEKR